MLRGAKTVVPAAHLAAAMIVPARTAEGDVLLFLVEPDADGVHVTRQDTFNHEPTFHVELADVAVEEDAVLGGLELDGAAALDWLVQRATVAVCALASGVADAGMRLTAGYATERKQFDRPIATFQAVGSPDGRLLRRQRGDSPHDADGGEPPRRGSLRTATKSTWRSTGRRTAAAGSVMPACTCTVASASTSTTRCTATSSGRSSSSSCSVPGNQHLATLGAALAAEPVAS